MGEGLRRSILRTAKEIVDAGIDDPEIFELVGILEEGVGADRISDMVGRIIVQDILTYTERVLRDLGAPTQALRVYGQPRQLVRNPYNRAPVLLVPRDILRDLPIAHAWEDIPGAAAFNEEVRRRFNQMIGRAGRRRTRWTKRDLRTVLIRNPDLFQDVVNVYKASPARRYDFQRDPSGEALWYPVTRAVAEANPLHLVMPASPSRDDVLAAIPVSLGPEDTDRSVGDGRLSCG